MNIQLSDAELREIFEQHLTGPRKALLSDAIISLLDSDWQKEKLFKAIHGIVVKQKFYIGQKVTIKQNSVSTYDCNLPAMQEAGLYVDDYFTATIKTFNPWTLGSYKVEYPTITDAGEPHKRTYDLSENYIFEAEVFPEHLSGVDPKTNSTEEEDLPF